MPAAPRRTTAALVLRRLSSLLARGGDTGEACDGSNLQCQADAICAPGDGGVEVCKQTPLIGGPARPRGQARSAKLMTNTWHRDDTRRRAPALRGREQMSCPRGARRRSLCAVFAGFLLLPLSGCKSKPEEPPSYLYAVTFVDANDAPTLRSSDYVLRLNGTKLAWEGMTETKSSDLIRVPRGTLLVDPATKLDMVFETSCGELALPARSIYDARTEKTDRGESVRYNLPIRWKVTAPGAAPLPRGYFYADNFDNPKPVVVAVGTWKRTVAANAGDAFTVPLGACADARSISVDGKVVGQVATEQVDLTKAAQARNFVDAVGGRCYVLDTQGYGAAGVGHERQELAQARVLAIPMAVKTFANNPDKVSVRVRVNAQGEAIDSAQAIEMALLRRDCKPTNKGRIR